MKRPLSSAGAFGSRKTQRLKPNIKLIGDNRDAYMCLGQGDKASSEGRSTHMYVSPQG